MEFSLTTAFALRKRNDARRGGAARVPDLDGARVAIRAERTSPAHLGGERPEGDLALPFVPAALAFDKDGDGSPGHAA